MPAGVAASPCGKIEHVRQRPYVQSLFVHALRRVKALVVSTCLTRPFPGTVVAPILRREAPATASGNLSVLRLVAPLPNPERRHVTYHAIRASFVCTWWVCTYVRGGCVIFPHGWLNLHLRLGLVV